MMNDIPNKDDEQRSAILVFLIECLIVGGHEALKMKSMQRGQRKSSSFKYIGMMVRVVVTRKLVTSSGRSTLRATGKSINQ